LDKQREPCDAEADTRQETLLMLKRTKYIDLCTAITFQILMLQLTEFKKAT